MRQVGLAIAHAASALAELARAADWPLADHVPKAQAEHDQAADIRAARLHAERLLAELQRLRR